MDPAEIVATDLAANADATAEPVTGEESAPSGDPVATPVTPEEKAKNQERINQLTRERYEAIARAENESRERQRLQQELERLRSEAKPQQVAPAKLPTLEEHGYDEAKYAEALLSHLRGQQQTPDIKAAIAEVLAEREQQQQMQTRHQTWKQKEAEFAKSKPDYQEKVRGVPDALWDPLAETIVESKAGPELAYYLAENLDVLEAISRLPQRAMDRELGRIEARLESAKAPPAAKPPVSQAPVPVRAIETTVEAAGAVKLDSPDAEKISDREWMRRRNAQVARKRS